MSDFDLHWDQPPRVLVVDDDPTTRMLVQESLQAEGFTVSVAKDGIEALHAFHHETPDLVLLDVVMPNMDGFETCEAIRNLPTGGQVPIVMITSLEDVDSVHRAYDVGATDFLTKPIHWALLPHRARYFVRGGRMFVQLKESQAKNEALLDAIPDLMCRIRPDGSLLEWKSSSESSLLDKANTRPFGHLNEVLDVALVERILAAASLSVRSGATQELEFISRKDGSDHSFEARLVKSGDDETLIIIRDITERKQMEDALRRSEEHFRSLIENNSDLIMILSENCGIEYASPSVIRTLRGGAEGPAGEDVFEFVHADDAPALRNAAALALSEHGVSHRGQIRFVDGEGTVLTIETILMAVRDASDRVRIILNARDVTERLEAEDALHESEEQLRQSQKMDAIGRLAGGVAHDFNNLLTAILGYSQILQETLQDDNLPVEEIVEIQKAATRACSLTRQLLTFSRKQVIQQKVIDLNVVAVDMENMLRRLLSEDIQLKTELDESVNPILVDPGQMEQVIMNLAVNARDAMPDGGVLTVKTENVVIASDQSDPHTPPEPGEYVRLTVSDTGVGMDHETRQRIFEPFFTTKEDGKGTGLGLSTVYGIAQQNNGCVFVDSVEGEGTTLSLYFPRTERTGTIADKGGSTLPRELYGAETVLVVEDESWVRSLVRQCLERHGYTVLEAEHGVDALHILDRYQGPIDLMITDVVMPKMNGVELAAHLEEERPSTRILFMSGYTDHAIFDEDVIDLEKSFLQKPFTVDDLAGRVRQSLNTEKVALS
jgi:PAS domain S-box-containing protein